MNLSEITLDNVFDTSTTGKQKYDNIMNSPEIYNELGVTSEIKYMSPDKAISMMAKGQGRTVKQVIDRRMKQGAEKKVQQFANDMMTGTKFDMPSMYYAPGGFMQDGYHRLMAAKLAGMKSVPVLIIRKQ